MSYNPRIINQNDGTIKISGSVAVNKSQTTLSSSNIVITNALTASSLSSNNGSIPTSSFSGFKGAIRKITSNTSISTSDHVILANTSNNSIVLTLPSSSLSIGQQFIIKKINSNNNITITGSASGEKIDGSSNKILSTNNEVVRLISDGTGSWNII